MGDLWKFFATVPRGLEGALAGELADMGIPGVAEGRAGVSFQGGLEHGYRACIWSRCASRVLVEVARVPAPDDTALYEGVRTVEWSEHMTVRQTFAVSFSSSRSTITHTNYGALKVKDAIADWFRDRGGERPSVDRENPHIRVQVHVEGEEAIVALDLSGQSLHRRNWRREAGPASLKENLAAGLLRLAEWPGTAKAGGGFVDPMCGGGTLAIEAALQACDTAPGLLRTSFGFQRWRHHDDGIFRRLIQEARERDARTRAELPPIVGFDNDPALVRAAGRNAASAGVARHVKFERRELALVEPVGVVPGIVVVNPPYGERLGQTKALLLLYQRIGMTLKHRFPEWIGYVFTGNMDAAKKLGLRVARRYPLYNGAIECRLLKIPVLKEKGSGVQPALSDRADEQVRGELWVGEETERGSAPATAAVTTSAAEKTAAATEKTVTATEKTSSATEKTVTATEKTVTATEKTVTATEKTGGRKEGAEDFANRVRKNLKKLRKWLEREGVTCYRVYDADLPDYALAVDVYEGFVHIREHERPDTVDPLKAEKRLHGAVAALREILGMKTDQLFIKHRERARGGTQYGRLGETRENRVVREGGLKFLVNPADYFDTGLFLDHRLTREVLRSHAKGVKFLNLFGYTGAATVYAAAGGAVSTTTVDLSATYLDWAHRNMELNGFTGPRHRFIEEDVLKWLPREKTKYGLIFLDPPTFSTSKSMSGTLDIQRDHVDLIRSTAALLAPGGLLVFSNNFKRFKLDSDALAPLEAEDITRSTIPPDFERNLRVHHTFLIRKP